MLVPFAPGGTDWIKGPRDLDVSLKASAAVAELVRLKALLEPPPDAGGAAALEQALEQGPAVAEQALAAAALDALAAGPLFEAVAGA